MNHPRLLLADACTDNAELLRGLLDPDSDVIELVCDGLAPVDAERLSPDVIVTDILMPRSPYNALCLRRFQPTGTWLRFCPVTTIASHDCVRRPDWRSC